MSQTTPTEKKQGFWIKLLGLSLFLSLAVIGLRTSGCAHSPVRTDAQASASTSPRELDVPKTQTNTDATAATTAPTDSPRAATQPRPTPAQPTNAKVGATAKSTDLTSLFHIKRNKNRNEVHYGIRLKKGTCEPKGKEPVYPYWRMYEKGPKATEKIGAFERMAYGISSQKVKENKILLRLVPLRSRLVEIVIQGSNGSCKVLPYTTIAKQRAKLHHIYVFAVSGFPLPRVKYITLHGSKDDKKVQEKIKR